MVNELDQRDDDDDENWSTVEYWEGVAEAAVRITVAGFAGSLIGLAKERLYQTQPQLNETPFTTSSTSVTSKVLVYEAPTTSSPVTASKQISKGLPRRPPRLPIRATTSGSTNLPIVWSISCMLFTIILESCRLSSPTNSMLQIVDSEINRTSSSDDNDRAITTPRIDFQNKIQRTAIVSLGDYTLGGTIAGLAGVVGQRRQIAQFPIASRLPSLGFGLATGFTLGIIAGTFQAAIDVVDLYLKEEERQANERRKQEELEGADLANQDEFK